MIWPRSSVTKFSVFMVLNFLSSLMTPRRDSTGQCRSSTILNPRSKAQLSFIRPTNTGHRTTKWSSQTPLMILHKTHSRSSILNKTKESTRSLAKFKSKITGKTMIVPQTLSSRKDGKQTLNGPKRKTTWSAKALTENGELLRKSSTMLNNMTPMKLRDNKRWRKRSSDRLQSKYKMNFNKSCKTRNSWSSPWRLDPGRCKIKTDLARWVEESQTFKIHKDPWRTTRRAQANKIWTQAMLRINRRVQEIEPWAWQCQLAQTAMPWQPCSFRRAKAASCREWPHQQWQLKPTKWRKLTRLARLTILATLQLPPWPELHSRERQWPWEEPQIQVHSGRR